MGGDNRNDHGERRPAGKAVDVAGDGPAIRFAQRVEAGDPLRVGCNPGSLGFLDRPHKPRAARQLFKRRRRAQTEIVDPLVAADQRQQGNGGVGEPSWQGHGRKSLRFIAAEWNRRVCLMSNRLAQT
jgi:hypothetical protein